MGIGIGEGFNSGFVSLTQIKLLAKEINKGYQVKDYNLGKYLVFYIKSNRGFVTIVKRGYRLKEGELILLDEKGFGKLADAFYAKKTSKTITTFEEYILQNEINKLTAEIMKQKPTKEQLEELYKDIQTFKKFYSEVRKLPRDILFSMHRYGLKGEEKERVQNSVTNVLELAAKELGLGSNLVVDVSGAVTYYSFNYFNTFYIRENVAEIYNFEVKRLLRELNFDDRRHQEFEAYCKTLYNEIKGEFVKEVAKDNYFYYYYYADFMEKLNKDRKNFNLEGIKQWYDFANGLKENTEVVRGLLNQKEF